MFEAYNKRAWERVERDVRARGRGWTCLRVRGRSRRSHDRSHMVEETQEGSVARLDPAERSLGGVGDCARDEPGTVGFGCAKGGEGIKAALKRSCACGVRIVSVRAGRSKTVTMPF
eukprot:4719978-Pleurochrysis_carterae.AAC.1